MIDRDDPQWAEAFKSRDDLIEELRAQVQQLQKRIDYLEAWPDDRRDMDREDRTPMRNAKHSREISDELIDAIAVETGADRRSVVRRFAGLPVRGAAGRAIDSAIASRGLRHMDREDRTPNCTIL